MLCLPNIPNRGIGGKHFAPPHGYGGNLEYDQKSCRDLWGCTFSRDEAYQSLSENNKEEANLVSAGKRGCIYLRVFDKWMECATTIVMLPKPKQRKLTEFASNV